MVRVTVLEWDKLWQMDQEVKGRCLWALILSSKVQGNTRTSEGKNKIQVAVELNVKCSYRATCM
jgi:hypothetical protein